MMLIAVVCIYSYGKWLLKEVSKFKNSATFSESGITINHTLYRWPNISHLKIFTKKEFDTEYNVDTNYCYLAFRCSNQSIELNIDDYNTDENEMKIIIEKYKSNKSAIKKLNHNCFENIEGYENYLDLDEKDSEQLINDVLNLANENETDLIEYCKNDVYAKIDKLELIYLALSEKYLRWETFLTNEFIRIFEISKKNNTFKTLSHLLDNLIPNDDFTILSDKVRVYLTEEIDSKNLITQLKALEYLNYWLNEDILKKEQHIHNKIKSKKTDKNWRIRYTAACVLEDNKYPTKLQLIDKIKAKFLPV